MVSWNGKIIEDDGKPWILGLPSIYRRFSPSIQFPWNLGIFHCHVWLPKGSLFLDNPIWFPKMEQYSSICSRLQLPRMDTRVPGGHRCCSFTREKSKRVYVCIYNTYDCSHPHQVGISLRIPYSIYLRTSGWLCTMIIIIWHTHIYIYIIYKTYIVHTI